LSFYSPIIEAISEYLRASVRSIRTTVDSVHTQMKDKPFSAILFTGGFSNDLIMRNTLAELPFLKDMPQIYPKSDGGCVLKSISMCYTCNAYDIYRELANCKTALNRMFAGHLRRMAEEGFHSSLHLGFSVNASWKSDYPFSQRQVLLVFALSSTAYL
jgi:hypothetical protein